MLVHIPAGIKHVLDQHAGHADPVHGIHLLLPPLVGQHLQALIEIPRLILAPVIDTRPASVQQAGGMDIRAHDFIGNILRVLFAAVRPQEADLQPEFSHQPVRDRIYLVELKPRPDRKSAHVRRPFGKNRLYLYFLRRPRGNPELQTCVGRNPARRNRRDKIAVRAVHNVPCPFCGE